MATIIAIFDEEDSSLIGTYPDMRRPVAATIPQEDVGPLSIKALNFFKELFPKLSLSFIVR